MDWVRSADVGDWGENRENRLIKKIILNFLYPPRCPICDEVLAFPWDDIRSRRTERSQVPKISASASKRCCASCEKALPWVEETVCMKCGKPVGDESQEYCEDCRRQEHFYDRGTAAFVYTGAMRHSIYRMKSSNRRDYVPFFAESMTRALARYLPRWSPEIIIPIPMHPRKRRRRGYNQSELLADEIGRLTGIPVRKDLLRCTRMVRSQKTLGRKERLRNLRGSFAACEAFPAVSRVLLVDDIYTTGSTVDEVSRVLRKCGVKSIFFVVLCIGKGKKAVCTDRKV